MHARSTAVRLSPRSFVVPHLSLRVSCRVVSWPKPRSRWVSHRRVITRARQWRDTLPAIALTAVQRHIRFFDVTEFWCPGPTPSDAASPVCPSRHHTAGYGQLLPGLHRAQHGFPPITICTSHHHITAYFTSRAPTEPTGVGPQGIGKLVFCGLTRLENIFSKAR